jgi:hypothetical protein
MKATLYPLLLAMLAFVPSAKAQNVLIENGFYEEKNTGYTIYLEKIGDEEYVLFHQFSMPIKYTKEANSIKHCGIGVYYQEEGNTEEREETICRYIRNSQNGISMADNGKNSIFFVKVKTGYHIETNCCGYLVVVRDGEKPLYNPEECSCD